MLLMLLFIIVIIVLIVVLVIVVIYKKRRNSMAEYNVYNDAPTFINKMYGEEQYTKTEDPDEELYEQMK